MKSHWKRSKVFEDIFEDFETPSKNFPATPVIFSYEYGIYDLPHKLPNDLRLRILGN